MPKIHSCPADFLAESTAPEQARLAMPPPANSPWAWGEDVPDSLIEGIYDTALDARNWSYVLSRFIKDLRCSGASFCVEGADPISIYCLMALQSDAAGRDLRRFQYMAPYLLWAKGRGGQSWSAAKTRLAVVSPAAFERSRLYGELLASQRAARRLEVLRLVDQGVASGLTLFRSGEMADFGPAEQDYLNALKPHLLRAVRLGRTLTDLRAARKSQVAALDRLPFGTLVLDSHGRVLLINRSAKRILSKTDALKIKLGRLAPARAKDTFRLEKFLGRCAGTGPQPEPCGDELLNFPDLAGQDSVSLLLAPIEPANGLDGTGAAATGFVFDSDHRPQICRPALQRLYQLTAAECRLVEALVSGETMGSAAGRFGTSKQTVRKQLSTIYQKTDTHRQAELMKLVLCGPAIIEQPGPG